MVIGLLGTWDPSEINQYSQTQTSQSPTGPISFHSWNLDIV